MYLDHIQFAGGKLKTVPLTVNADKEWVFDPEILKSALSDKTTLLILNTPHNPTGKCFTLDELEEITDIVKQYPKLTVLADEVYDFLTFDGARHTRQSTHLPHSRIHAQSSAVTTDGFARRLMPSKKECLDATPAARHAAFSSAASAM